MRILIADDHAIMRDGLRMILEAQDGMTVVGEASDGRQAVHLARQLHPDVVIMDIAMPELNGIEATGQIVEACARTRVVMLSMHSGAERVYRALKAGAMGFVLKESAGRELVDAIRAVHAEKRYLSRPVAEVVTTDYMERRDAARQVSPVDSLSPREREVLQLVAEGKSSKEIAEAIRVSPKSVDTYRSRLMQKLRIDNVPDLVRFAMKHGVTGEESQPWSAS